MAQPLSMDLRSRVLAAIDGGMSCRAAAARFGVAPATAIPVAGAAVRYGRGRPYGARRRHALLAGGGTRI